MMRNGVSYLQSPRIQRFFGEVEYKFDIPDADCSFRCCGSGLGILVLDFAILQNEKVFVGEFYVMESLEAEESFASFQEMQCLLVRHIDEFDV
jgi:hypothetical protein